MKKGKKKKRFKEKEDVELLKLLTKHSLTKTNKLFTLTSILLQSLLPPPEVACTSLFALRTGHRHTIHNADQSENFNW
jgi:hypothetical protein